MRRIKLLWVVLTLSVVALLAVGMTPASAAPEQFVKIANFQYEPSSFTVTKGAIVAVANADGRNEGIPHSLTALNGSFDTGVFVNGIQSFQAPTQRGVYQFYCVVHEFMKGSLRVSNQG